eukprot:3057539-Karenia_brevis.AAC.1
MSISPKGVQRGDFEDGERRQEVGVLEHQKVCAELSQQRASSMNPKPSEVLGVEGHEESGVAGEEKYTSDEWMRWMWEVQVGAVQNPSVQCW